MKEIVKELLLWLERILPGLLASFGLGYKMGSKDKEKIEGSLRDEKLEHEKTKNRLHVQSLPYDPNNAIDAIVKRGDEMLKRKGTSSDS